MLTHKLISILNNLEGTFVSEEELMVQYWMNEKLFIVAYLVLRELAINSIKLHAQLQHDNLTARSRGLGIGVGNI